MYENGISTYTIKYKGFTFTGTAHCAPEDQNYANPIVGEEIAELRAIIKYLRYIRDNEIKPGLKALKQLYYSMAHSKNFNSKSYEAKMLYRQLHIKEEELAGIKYGIKSAQEQIKLTINQFERTKQFLIEKSKS